MEIKTGYLPPVFFKIGQQVLHFAGIPVFFFLFVILYRPFDLGDTLSLRWGGFAFNVSIIASILLVVLAISRLILWGVRNAATFKRRSYFMWCVGEVVVSSLFVSLYVYLISGKYYTYIDIIPYALAYLAAVLVFPYVIFTLLLESDILTKYGAPASQSETRLKFYDERHNLKFVTEPSAILSIASDTNYCNITYTEGGQLKVFTIRGSLKIMEEVCLKSGIVRCHRSYLVNVRRIKVLRKDRDGIIRAEMDFPKMESIPVTPKYYDSIASMI